MPPYRSPEAGTTSYFRKFIRLGNDVFLAVNERAIHQEIVDGDNLQPRIDQLRTQAPFEIDAGIISSLGPQELRVWEHSTGLGLPIYEVERDARRITELQVALLSPGLQVVDVTVDDIRAELESLRVAAASKNAKAIEATTIPEIIVALPEEDAPAIQEQGIGSKLKRFFGRKN